MRSFRHLGVLICNSLLNYEGCCSEGVFVLIAGNTETFDSSVDKHESATKTEQGATSSEKDLSQSWIQPTSRSTIIPGTSRSSSSRSRSSSSSSSM